MSTSLPDVPSDELTPLIAWAVDLGHAGMALIDELRTEDGTGATLPESTVVRLHFVAASTFQSGLLCLWMPETSLASYGLIRGLLEVWSHLIFISDDMQVVTPGVGRCDISGERSRSGRTPSSRLPATTTLLPGRNATMSARAISARCGRSADARVNRVPVVTSPQRSV